ncbi:hypothetical protein ACXR2U_12530 [Jatrophihabitans sp. YIM 134969]
MPDMSPAARDRAVDTVIAAAAFGDATSHILGACAELDDEQTVVVAVVEPAGEGRRGLLLSGCHYVGQTDLVEKVPELEGDAGWAMVFSRSTNALDIRRRTEEMATIAEKRIAMLDRINAKREAREAATDDTQVVAEAEPQA